MSYQRKLEREKAAWVTLADTVAHVLSAEGIPSPATASSGSIAREKNGASNYDVMSFDPFPAAAPEEDALVQIRWALHDGEIPIRWAQEPRPVNSSYHPNTIFDPDLPPPLGPFWLYAEISHLESYAVNDVTPLPFFTGFVSEWPAHRRLRRLLLCRERVFELWPVRATKQGPADKPRVTTEQAEELVRNTARELYKTEQPNLVRAEQLIRKLVPGIGRKVIRAVLLEEEFTSRRKPAGNSLTRSRR